MGDGSARRTEKAPGWLDERAAASTPRSARRLRPGIPSALAVDLALGAELLAAGAPPWAAAAGLLAAGAGTARLSYDEAPYGVGYLVATWSLPAGLTAVPQVIAVVGPTAAGKSDLGVALAQRLGGEVINADSMQLYRGMDIGTAKLTTAERRGVPHHLLDIWDPAASR